MASVPDYAGVCCSGDGLCTDKLFDGDPEDPAKQQRAGRPGIARRALLLSLVESSRGPEPGRFHSSTLRLALCLARFPSHSLPRSVAHSYLSSPPLLLLHHLNDDGGVFTVRYHGHMTPAQRLRQVANLLNASTLLGLLLARSSGCSISRGPRGLLVATGYRSRLPIAAAFAVGNVVLFRCGPEQVRKSPVLLGHEERHCTQYAWCLGLPFLPLYFLAAGWSFLRTGSAGTGNIFEQMAGLEAGGYTDSHHRRRTVNLRRRMKKRHRRTYNRSHHDNNRSES
jgi:hypothetical protein